MHLALAVFAVVFVILGFAGFAAGGIPTIVFWGLAALCVVGAWRSRPKRIGARDDMTRGPQP
jgi:hypothetical protein